MRQVKRLFEEKTGWGDSDLWKNQDFLELSRMIFDRTGVALSHVTLKCNRAERRQAQACERTFAGSKGEVLRALASGKGEAPGEGAV